MKNVKVLALIGVWLCLCITCSYKAPIMTYEDVDVKPEPINLPQPEYPEAAKNEGIQGQTLTKVLVGVDGKIEQATIEESSTFEILDMAALTAVQKAEFKPASHKGKPVKVWVTIPIKFTLADKQETKLPDEMDKCIIAYHIVEVKPRPIDIPTPEYPESARKDGIEGRTLVRALIDFDGSISETEISQSSGSEVLDKAALSAVQKSTFEPASHEGNPVKVWVTIPIQFKLSS